MVSDFISLLLQAGGGAVVEIATDFSVEHIGIHLTIAGLALQVASLGVFLVLCADFTIKCLRNNKHLSSSQSHKRIRGAVLFKSFLGGESTYLRETTNSFTDLIKDSSSLPLLSLCGQFTGFLSCQAGSMESFGTTNYISVSIILEKCFFCG
jgi:hypothetical protein